MKIRTTKIDTNRRGKTLSYLLAAGLALAAAQFALAAYGGVELNVGTFNIRCQNKTDKGVLSWGSRKADVVDLIRKMKCDVIGLQEVTPPQMQYLKGALKEYGIVGVFRNADLKSGEASPVCYLKRRFDLVKEGTFWLSETPDKSGSKSWGAALPRICTYAILKDRSSGKRICFANAHTDHKSDAARVNGAKVIGERLKTVCEGAPVVLVGDHNCSDGNAASVYLRGIYTDAIYATKTPPRGPWRTYTGWVKIDKELSAASALKMKPSEREKANACRIDYIYVSPKVIDVLAYTTVSVTRKGVGAYCSDHFPSVSRIRLR